MTEPTTEELIHGLSNYDLTTYGGVSKLHDIAHGAASRLVLLSRQNEELQKARSRDALAEVIGSAIRESGYVTNPDMDFHVADAVIRALSSVPSPSETEKSDAAEDDGWVRIVTLPDDLVVGDRLEIIIEGPWITRARIEEIHHNEPPAGRGYCVNGRWLSCDMISAYRRTAGERK